MILVDTSVLIDYLKGVATGKTALFQEVLDGRFVYGICDIVHLEILQGARDEAEYRELRDYLETQRFYDLRHGQASFERAARMHYECRRSGRTVRSTIDLIIAQIAIENELALLHSDSDFDSIAEVTELRCLERLGLS